MTTASILDAIHPTLPPEIWEDPAAPEPKLKPEHASFIHKTIYGVLVHGGYSNPERWLHLVLTGSLTTHQYGDTSDVDVSLFINNEVFPEWSRAEMIGLMTSEADGTILPGTTFPLQCFVVAAHIKPTDLYKPGLRSGYDIDKMQWIVPPDPKRDHDVQAQENGFYVYALETADKMERLIRYEPDKAVQMWHALHRRRHDDQVKGKGDFSESNIIYKFLAKRGLMSQIEAITGEHIAGNVIPSSRMRWTSIHDAAIPNVPNAEIQQMARAYNEANGLPNHPDDYIPVNPSISAQIAQAYDQLQHNPDDPAVQRAYDALKRETAAQYVHTVNNGYRFEFYPEGVDPYPNSPREAIADLTRNKHMYVYPTESGFGVLNDTGAHPLLEHTGEFWNGRPVTYNDMFRAIHDVYGHGKEGFGFRADGEDNAYRQHAAMFSPIARPAMASETRGQNSWVNFGPYGQTNQTAGQGDTVYADQKAGLLPTWAQDPNLHLRGL